MKYAIPLMLLVLFACSTTSTNKKLLKNYEWTMGSLEEYMKIKNDTLFENWRDYKVARPITFNDSLIFVQAQDTLKADTISYYFTTINGEATLILGNTNALIEPSGTIDWVPVVPRQFPLPIREIKMGSKIYTYQVEREYYGDSLFIIDELKGFEDIDIRATNNVVVDITKSKIDHSDLKTILKTIEKNLKEKPEFDRREYPGRPPYDNYTWHTNGYSVNVSVTDYFTYYMNKADKTTGFDAIMNINMATHYSAGEKVDVSISDEYLERIVETRYILNGGSFDYE